MVIREDEKTVSLCVCVCVCNVCVCELILGEAEKIQRET